MQGWPGSLAGAGGGATAESQGLGSGYRGLKPATPPHPHYQLKDLPTVGDLSASAPSSVKRGFTATVLFYAILLQMCIL